MRTSIGFVGGAKSCVDWPVTDCHQIRLNVISTRADGVGITKIMAAAGFAPQLPIGALKRGKSFGW